MALIRFSNSINDIRGASGGNVFSRSLAGATVSARSSRCQPFSTATNRQQSQFRQAVSLWRTLNGAERASWGGGLAGGSVMNRLGQAIHPSAFQRFARTVGTALLVGQAPPSLAPAPEEIPRAFLGTLNIALANQMLFQWVQFSGYGQFQVAVWATAPQHPAIIPKWPREYRWIGNYQAADLISNFSLTAKYRQQFAFIPASAGMRISVAYQLINLTTFQRAPLGFGSDIVFQP